MPIIILVIKVIVLKHAAPFHVHCSHPRHCRCNEVVQSRCSGSEALEQMMSIQIHASIMHVLGLHQAYA